MAKATSPRRRRQVPIVGPWVKSIRRRLGIWSFAGSEAYWQRRYQDGQGSGAGSYGQLAQFKAEYLNRFVAEHAIADVIEFGCGDGNQRGQGSHRRDLAG